MFELLTDIFGSTIIAAFISAALPLGIIVLFTLLAVYMERKVSAHMQDRLGPMRVGWHGTLQLIADFIKLLQKEDIVASSTDKKFFNFAPFLVFMGTYGVYAALPFSSQYIGTEIDLGIFYIIAISGLVVAGILMAGWSSNNKYSLYGAIRSAAQIISYEIPTAIVILSMVMYTGTLSLAEMSEMQTANFLNWNIFGGPEWGLTKLLLLIPMLLGFIILYMSTLAEANRTPFDMPEAESELVAGYNTEYSGIKFSMFFLAEYGNMFAVSAIVSVVFFGGYQSPFGYAGDLLGAEWMIPFEQVFWFCLKGVFFVFVQQWLRWTLPRVRVDQLMAICWKYLIPYSVLNLIIIGIITLL